jgi:hypothetical protein
LRAWPKEGLSSFDKFPIPLAAWVRLPLGPSMEAFACSQSDWEAT